MWPEFADSECISPWRTSPGTKILKQIVFRDDLELGSVFCQNNQTQRSRASVTGFGLTIIIQFLSTDRNEDLLVCAASDDFDVDWVHTISLFFVIAYPA